MVKLPPSLATRTRAPIISVPPVAPKRLSPSQKASLLYPVHPQVPVSFVPATGANSSHSVCTRILHFHLLAPRSRLLTTPRPNYLQAGSTLWANKRFGERPHEVRKTKDAR